MKSESSSEYALTGRRRHKYMEENTPLDQIPIEDQPAIDKARKLKKAAIKAFNAKVGKRCVKVDRYTEERLWAIVDNVNVGSGQLDEFLVALDSEGLPILAFIIDYKMMFLDYGPASENEQLENYSLLVRDFVSKKYGVPPDDGVGCALIQPLCKFNKLTLAYRSNADLAICQVIHYQALSNATSDEPKEFVPGTKQCKLCSFILYCKAHEKIMESIIDTDPHKLTIPQLEDLLDLCATIKEKISQAEAKAKELLDGDQSEEFTRYRLESTGYNESFTDSTEALDMLRAIDMEHYVTDDQVLEVVNLTPNALAKAYAKSAKINEKEAKEFIRENCGKLINRKKKADSLKPINKPKAKPKKTAKKS